MQQPQGDLVAVRMPEASGTRSWEAMFALWSDTRDTLPAGSDLYFKKVLPFDPPPPPATGEPAVVGPGFQGYATASFTGHASNHPPTNSGVIVAWADDRNGALDVYARRLFDSPFNLPWPADGVPVPVRLREAIRAKGPTVVYGDAERAKLTGNAA